MQCVAGKRVALFAFTLGFVLGCYGVPTLEGLLFGCGDGASCADGLVCDDGVCCRTDGRAPVCPVSPLDDGRCFDGGAPFAVFRDLDGDGFGTGAERMVCATPRKETWAANAHDCNDNPAAGGARTFPDAGEDCDGYDNDCDGEVDEGFPNRSWFYLDQDGDTYGDPDAGVFACLGPNGYVSRSGDCAPSDAVVSPSAVEVCNGKDDNCNGAVDETKPTWFRDADGDGWGDGSSTLQSCQMPTGYVSRQGDCNDADRSIHPDAQDICDGLDNDCQNGIDSRPDCGGHADLLGSVEVSKSAVRLNQAYGGITSTCLKNAPSSAGDSIAGATWTGSGATSHVAWFENTRGTWDLSRANQALRFEFTQFMSGQYGSPLWSRHWQPVVILCGEDGSARRYVPMMDGGNNPPPLLPYGGFEVQTTIPLAVNGNGWVVGSGATLQNLRAVKRVEVLVQPTDPGDGGTPSFTFTFRRLGFVP